MHDFRFDSMSVNSRALYLPSPPKSLKGNSDLNEKDATGVVFTAVIVRVLHAGTVVFEKVQILHRPVSSCYSGRKCVTDAWLTRKKTESGGTVCGGYF